jgi:RPA family protein
MNSRRDNRSRFAGFEREPAKRVFAAELREARLQFKDGDDEKSPSYILLPTGERSNRIFLCGRLTQKERRGDQNAFYTARIEDPTGTFFINAGSYQPDAMQQLSQVAPDTYVAVVGKPVIRTTSEGSVFVSVRAETVVPLGDEEYFCWVLDCADLTLDRLDEFGSTDDSRKAQEFYNTNPQSYRQMVYDALSRMQFR